MDNLTPYAVLRWTLALFIVLWGFMVPESRIMRLFSAPFCLLLAAFILLVFG